MPRDVSFLGITLNTYSLLISLAILLSAWLIVRAVRSTIAPSRMINLCLAMLAGGLIMARIEHIVLNWDYFTRQIPDLLQWVFPQRGEPGLGWHGAVIGALAAFFAYRLPRPKSALLACLQFHSR
jgi:prolipoprotein diacylglyceryltransferase